MSDNQMLLDLAAWESCDDPYQLFATCCLARVPMTQIGQALIALVADHTTGEDLQIATCYLNNTAEAALLLQTRYPIAVGSVPGQAAWNVITWIARNQAWGQYEDLYDEIRAALTWIVPYDATGTACAVIRQIIPYPRSAKTK